MIVCGGEQGSGEARMSSATTTYAERVASCRPPTPLLRSPPGNAMPRPPVRRLLDFSAGGGLDHEDDDEFLCRAGEMERSHQEAKCRTAQGPAPPAFREKQCICARGPCDVVWEERGGRRGWAYVCSALPKCIHFAWSEESDHNPNSQPSFRSHPEPIHPRAFNTPSNPHAFNTPSNHRAGASTPQGADATTPINVSPQGARSNDWPICKCRAGKCKKSEIKGVYFYICPIPKGQGACPYRVRVNVASEELLQTGKNNPKENNHLEYNPVKKKANEHNLVNIAENTENGPVNLDQPEHGEGSSGIVDDKIVPNDSLALAPFAVVAHARESPSMLHQPIAMVELETPTKSPMPPTGTISPITPRSNYCFRCGEEGHWSTSCPKPPLPCYRRGEDLKTPAILKLIKTKSIKNSLPFTKMASSPAAGPWDHCSHGEHDGGFAELLRQLMLYLGFTHPPLYRGRMTKVMGHESWEMEVFLYARTGEFVAHTFHAEAPRCSSLDAIQDAARVAITSMCWMHENLLRGSPFCFFPYLSDGERFPESFDAIDNEPRLTHQVQLTQAMILSIHSCTDEIRQLRMLLTGSDAHSTLHANLSRSDEALYAAIWERDTVTAERDAALAEVARLTAALASATSAPVL